MSEQICRSKSLSNPGFLQLPFGPHITHTTVRDGLNAMNNFFWNVCKTFTRVLNLTPSPNGKESSEGISCTGNLSRTMQSAPSFLSTNICLCKCLDRLDIFACTQGPTCILFHLPTDFFVYLPCNLVHLSSSKLSVAVCRCRPFHSVLLIILFCLSID